MGKREEEKKILRARFVGRTKEGRGRRGAGRGGKEVDGETPQPTTLFIPLAKSTNAKNFRVMADFNPRRQYIGVYLYFFLNYTLNFYLFQKLA